MVVPIEQIEEYSRNPRRGRNDAYDRIKQSITSRGFMGSLPITRRPGEPHYVVAEGGNTVLHVLKELYAETKDPRFHAIHCLFEPWCGESEILIAHLIENDVRGDLVFIDRALAVRDLRRLLQQENAPPLSGRELAAKLRERGYGVDQPTISKMDYAIERLLPVIPVALRAGLGRDQVDHIRKLENRLVQFLEHRGKEVAVIEEARKWFLECLTRHDREDWSLAPIAQALIARFTEIGGDDANHVLADLDVLDSFGQAGRDGPPLAVPARHRLARANARAGTRDAPRDQVSHEGPAAGSLRERTEDPSLVVRRVASQSENGRVSQGSDREPTGPAGLERPALPMDLQSLRARLWTLATQLAQRNGLSDCVLPCGNQGCGYLVDLPEQPLYAGDLPETAQEAKRVILWWLLSALAEQWPYAPSVEAAPALGCLHEEARLYPAIEAITRADERTAIEVVSPLVSEPPSLDIASRQLFAVLDEREFELFTMLIQTRRALQAHCRRIGKPGIWEI